MAAEGDDGSGTTFKANFTAEGVATLKARIEDKLKDFMGDYTDDTLVVSMPYPTLLLVFYLFLQRDLNGLGISISTPILNFIIIYIFLTLPCPALPCQDYVIVLLRNGRRKAEAAQELHVFLGDDRLSFISWLVLLNIIYCNNVLLLHFHLFPFLLLMLMFHLPGFGIISPLTCNSMWRGRAPAPTPSPPVPTSEFQRDRDSGKTIKRLRRDWNIPEENLLHSTATTTTTTGTGNSKETAKRQKIVWENTKKDEVKPDRVKERPRFPLRSVVTGVLNPADKGGDRKPSSSQRVERRRVQEDDLQPIKVLNLIALI
jgi:hypothetical protein